MNFLEKLLSIVVPCYNAEDYVERCINSLVLGGDKVEIILVNDGSTDGTGRVIDYYQEEFPNQIVALHQANGGHGQAVNTGVYAASAPYVKIVDSDDWVSFSALKKILAFIEKCVTQDELVDMILSNYVYDKVGAKHKKVVSYSFLPQGKVFSWDKVHLVFGQYLLMHAIIYRTELLTKECHLQLPKHTFYVDNLYAFEPLGYVKSIYYLDVDFYHYFIGRDDQSVNEQVMLKRIDQQLAVNKRMVRFYVENVAADSPQARYMKYYLEIITTVSSILLIRGKKAEYLAKKKELWQYIKTYDVDLYRKLRRRVFGVGVNLPGRIGRSLASGVYRVVHKVYGFN